MNSTLPCGKVYSSSRQVRNYHLEVSLNAGTSTITSVKCTCFHGQFSFIEGSSRNLDAHMTTVNKYDISCLFLWRREVLLINAIGQSSGRGVIHQFEDVEASNSGCV